MLSRLPSIARRVAAARLRSASPSSLAGGATVAAAAAAASAAAADASCSMPLAEWYDQAPLADGHVEAIVRRYECDPNYVRIDRLFAEDRDSATTGSGHAIFDSLGAKSNAVRTYRIYCTLDGSETVSVATLMPGSEGHPGIVHGGVTALLFDNTLGWANAVARLANAGALGPTLRGRPVDQDTVSTFGFTAYLNTSYRAPCKVGTTLVLSCSAGQSEGRKLFVRGEARDAATGTLIAEADALFVRPRQMS